MQKAREVNVKLFVVADEKVTDEQIAEDVWAHLGECDQFTFFEQMVDAEQWAATENTEEIRDLEQLEEGRANPTPDKRMRSVRHA